MQKGKYFIHAGRLALLLLMMLVMVCVPLAAHEIRPAIIDLKIGDDGQLVLIQRVNLESLLAGIGSEHNDTDDSDQASEYQSLRRLPPDRLQARFSDFLPRLLAGSRLSVDQHPVELRLEQVTIPPVGDIGLARDSSIELRGVLPADAINLNWSWDKGFGANVLRVDDAEGGEIHSAYLLAGQASDNIALSTAKPGSGVDLFLDYVIIGFDHILPKGLDHILFVVGLFLLNARLSSLLWQVTSFTLAHTLTLALGIYGIVQMPAAIVEPLIAASIVYVCVENLFCSHLTRWRPLVVFMFGLLHGLGFAGVLREIGLAPEHFVSGLVGFNVGVELGQLAVIGGCFLAVGLWFRRKAWYRQLITVPASLVIALIGSYWFVERMLIAF